MKYLITTVGISAIEKAGITVENYKRKSFSYFDNCIEDLEKEVKKLLDYFYKIEVTENNLKNFSAEIKSLYKLGVRPDSNDYNPNDYFVYLLCSDTAICRIGAEFLRRFLEEKMKLNQVHGPIKIEGLVIDNPETFYYKGLKSLCKLMIEEILNKITISKNHQVLLNITGGFKATIPYLTLFAMVYGVSICYIFEDEDELLEIPPLPVNFDLNFIDENYDIFVEIEANTYISTDRIDQRIKNSDKFKIYFQQENNFITTTYIGDMLWEKYKRSYKPKPPQYNESKEKRINLGNIEHHGKSKLHKIANKIINNSYVVEIINSSNNQPNRRREKVIPLRKQETTKYIQREEEGICLVIDDKSDEGFCMLVKTTGRIYWETQFIAEELKKEY